ncbi:MAG: DUF4173 domain-containing protein [Rhizobiales bacterium]|nr:DUF4173 domain-containing protein [Hyphomicrobiales bacterium]
MNRPLSTSALSVKASATLLLTGAADFLLFGQPQGVSLSIFGCLLVAALAATHPGPAAAHARLAWIAMAVATLLPLVENISTMSISIALFGLSACALSISGRLRRNPADIARRVIALLVASPLRLPRDIIRSRNVAAKMHSTGAGLAGIAIWTLPVVLGAVFFILFGVANPVIDYWISLIDLRVVFRFFDIWRIAFWLAVLALTWALLRPRLPKWPSWLSFTAAATGARPQSGKKAPTALAHLIFGKAAILRALLVFNVLFAVQTILDGSYLWAGAALPNGLTYASYAHRGAYPLIVTALLAAIFVLIAMRPGSEMSADRRIRGLVYAWIAQNVMLVISSILRLDLYIGVYSLTYWRVAAFIWMGLVAAGLILIMARIALRQTNGWLLSANLLALSAVLYACCFINFAAIIADYNVKHSREMNGGELALDLWYLHSLGQAAIPAFDLLLENAPDADTTMKQAIRAKRASQASEFLARQRNWRAWTFRNWRLARYLDSHPEPAWPSMRLPGP